MSNQVCLNCLKPGKVADGVVEAGRETEYAGVDAYIAGTDKQNAIIYSTDIFSMDFPNNRKLADAFAAAGFTVIMPRTTIKGDIPTDLALFPQWLERNPVATASSIIARVVAQARTEFTNVLGVGFCYGARMIADALIGSSPSLKAAVLYHPTFMTPADATALRTANTPILFNLASVDRSFNDELKATFQTELASVDGVRFETYEGTEHGFGVRPKNEAAEAQAARARDVAVDYFRKHRV